VAYTGIAAGCGAAAAVLVGVAIVARLRVRAPAVSSFALVAATMGVAAIGVGAGFAVGSRLGLVSAVVLAGLVLPLVWLFFVFEYIGQEEFLSMRVAGLVATPVLFGTFATAFRAGTAVVPWYTLPAAETATGAAAVGLAALELSQWFGLLYAGGLVIAGAGAILWTFRRYRHLDTATGIAIGAFGVVPWLSLLFGLQLESVSVLALGVMAVVGFGTGASAAAALVGPAALFDRAPSAGRVGARRLIEEIDDLVVVLGPDGRVAELNASAAAAFGGAGEPYGAAVETLLGRSVEELTADELIELDVRDGRRLFTARVSGLTDGHGVSLGHAVVLRDVTDRQGRQQLLDVFNRVLRHNLRNQMNVIIGHANLARERTDDPASVESLETIVRIGWELSELSDKAREAERILEVDAGDGRTPLGELIADAVETLPARCRVRTEVDASAGEELIATAPAEPLGLALQTLVENAVEHSDRDEPLIVVSADYNPGATYPVELAVADDGPGIPAAEQEAIRAGRETALEHGSGLGLWIVRLIATQLGGEMRLGDREPRGAIVTLCLPGERVRADRRDPESLAGSGASTAGEQRRGDETPKRTD